LTSVPLSLLFFFLLLPPPPPSPLFPYTTLFRSQLRFRESDLVAHVDRRRQRGIDALARRKPRRGKLRDRDRGGMHFWQHSLQPEDRKSTRLNSSHSQISYAVFCLKKKKKRKKKK